MADILIRGMDMGNITTSCPFRADDGFGGCYCVTGADYCTGPFAERGEDCPVTVLPEGHGDLIDRDAFWAENGLNAKCEHRPTNTYEMLDNAPVIVPAEGGGKDG